ncbi:restriction endonuclease subunit S [Alsobacter sp. SYSU M60028]|uniref:Restriction endonuclease subunit S n=1 Tax=Alsobacter ponti TaxID=2962936 RepID=A0ABT1LAL2_9HYPH|nr:restriction endonuclease subunit S [Alsobacter ponti]MCP8938520.1 restriction endonuclease subunit S [Alsobacter ponti]
MSGKDQEHWTRLRGLIVEQSRRVGSICAPPVASVTNSNGMQPAETTFSRQVFSRDLSNYKIVQTGDYAFNPSRANVGSLARNELGIDVCVSPMYTVFKVTSGDVDARYLHAFLKSRRFIGRVGSSLQGSVREALSFDTLETFPFWLPPLGEQRAIADVLGAVDAGIRKTEELRAQLLDTADALAEALFKGVDPVTGEKNTSGWRSSTLAAEMATIQVGIVVKPASYYVPSGGVPALRSLNVRPNRLNLSDVVRISDDGHRLNGKSALRPGDVVTVRTGEPGKTAVIPSDFGPLNCIDIIFSRPGSEIRGEYVSYFMNSGAAKRQISVLQGGLAQQHLNVGEMKRIKIEVPPLPYQDQAIGFLNALWLRFETEEVELSQLCQLRDALAQELLSGRLRLPESMIARHAETSGQAA